MEIHTIASCQVLNFLLKEENLELLEGKDVNVEHLEDPKINFDCYIVEGVVKYSWVPKQFDIDVKVLANDIQELLAFKKSSSRTKTISHCTTIFKHIHCVLDQN